MPSVAWVLKRMDLHPLNFCGVDFNITQPTSRENFFIARKVDGTKVDIRAFTIPGVDPRIRLSVTHICTDEKEFIVFRFKYARHHITPTGVKISAKICFLDISICKEYDPSYVYDKVPDSFQHLYNQVLNKF